MYLIDFHGDVNQLKEVAGRLKLFYVISLQLCANRKNGDSFFIHSFHDHLLKSSGAVALSDVTHSGGFSLGFSLGSSLALPAGLASASSLVSTSNSISILPWEK